MRPLDYKAAQQVLHGEYCREDDLSLPQSIEPHRPDLGNRFKHDDRDTDQNGAKQPQVEGPRSATATKDDFKKLFSNAVQSIEQVVTEIPLARLGSIENAN